MLYTIKNLLAYIIILIIILSGLIYFYKTETERKYLTVVFLDVGQGDAIFIETPSGNQVLIDGGPGSTVVHRISRYLPFYDRKIDLVLASHFDSDHVSGFLEIFKKYKILNFVTNHGAQTNSIGYLGQEIMRLVNIEKSNQFYLWAGDEIILDSKHDIKIEILWPPENMTDALVKKIDDIDRNDRSVVTRLSYGSTSFLFTGDIGINQEKILTANLFANINNEPTSYKKLSANVLKAGHHGSKNSSSVEFLTAVSPEYFIISAGIDNRFGHPAPQVIDQVVNLSNNLLKKRGTGIIIKNTAEIGDIFFQSDGSKVWFRN